MNELTIAVEWQGSTTTESLSMHVDCTDGNHKLVFTPPEKDAQTVTSAGQCTVDPVVLDSSIELDRSGCPASFDLTETNQSCDLVVVGFDVGVPAFTNAGLAILVAAVVAVGLLKLSQSH